MFEASAMVVAHPDDDILWLSGALAQVEQTVFCFNDHPRQGELGGARLRTIAEYPLANVSSLEVVEPMSFNKADWTRPLLTEYGVELGKDRAAELRYQTAHAQLLPLLRPVVAGRKNIFTHNPWGEYGHEDHILVYRALSQLQSDYGYTLWFSNYCSSHSVHLMNSCVSRLDALCEPVPANLQLAQRIAALYKKNGCWTWFDDYRWFEQECLFAQPVSGAARGVVPDGRGFPLNYISVQLKTEPAQPPRPAWRKALARLKRKLIKAP